MTHKAGVDPERLDKYTISHLSLSRRHLTKTHGQHCLQVVMPVPLSDNISSNYLCIQQREP